MPIRQLSPLLVNQIAAGEVIERPASVVKELVENAIDAGATQVDVLIEDGGKQLIRIRDDGHGIPADELPLAVSPHATSKLWSPQQLADIRTLGFRGEALASIASVSRTRIMSRPTLVDEHGEVTVSESGAVIEVNGGEQVPVAPASGSAGTVIEVKNLFFNTPARRKFLKSSSSEFGQISEVMTRTAMVHPEVGFTLQHGNRKTLNLPTNQTRRDRCVHLLGKELDEALLEFEDERQVITESDPTLSDEHDEKAQPPVLINRVWGLAGLPNIARATSKFQYVCLNGRPIKDRSISHAIKEAYRGLIPPDRQPVAVIFLEVDPVLVDVNVHPAKTEVRFHRASKVHGLVLQGLRQRLLGADLTPNAVLPGRDEMHPSHPNHEAATADPQTRAALQAEHMSLPGLESPAPVASTFDTGNRSPGFPNRSGTGNSSGGGNSYRPNSTGGSHRASMPAGSGFGHSDPPLSDPSRSAGSAIPDTQAFVDYFRRMDPRQKGFVYQQVKEDYAREASQDQPPTGDGHRAGVSESAVEFQPQLAAMPSPAIRILQVHKSYLVTQDEHGLLIIDQHALHERVMFEELRQRVIGEGKRLESQRMLMPVVLNLSPQRLALMDALQPLFDPIGIEAEPIGPDAYGLQAFPSFLFHRNVDPVDFMEELLDRVEEGDIEVDTDTALEAAMHEVLDMMACKAAVKAGDQMSEAELMSLLQKREQIERASNCPHGRPTTVRLTLRDLEKQFKRS